MPQFPGGPSAMMTFVATTIRYPEAAVKSNTQGRVVVSFVVNTDGSVSDAHVRRSISPELDAEALRVVGNMPQWTPGLQDGKPVRVKYTLPITFKLQGSDSPVTAIQVKADSTQTLP